MNGRLVFEEGVSWWSGHLDLPQCTSAGLRLGRVSPGLRRGSRQGSLMTALQGDRAPYEPDQHVDVPPMIDVDDRAEPDVADEHDIGAEQVGLPRPVAQED